MLLAVVSVAGLGFVVGWPTIRRRGLFLALATFSISAVASKFVFDQPYFTSDISVNSIAGFRSDRMFYVLELICLGAALLVVQNHHLARLGRSLQAIRDDERGALACGVNVRRLRIWVFSVSAGLAALDVAHFGAVVTATAAEVTTLKDRVKKAADAISASRPGARSEQMDTYLKRLEGLEKIGLSFPGVRH